MDTQASRRRAMKALGKDVDERRLTMEGRDELFQQV